MAERKTEKDKANKDLGISFKGIVYCLAGGVCSLRHNISRKHTSLSCA
jgi:hypothetical protein